MILTFFLGFSLIFISEYPKAEREGFEPPVPLSTAVFKTAVIDHSTISPLVITILLCLNK